MTTFQETFNNLIASLSDKNEELSPEALSQLAEALSDIAPVQLKPLLEAWENIPLPRRYSLLVHLQSELDKELLYNYEAFARTLLHDEDDIIRTFSLRLLKDYEGEDLLPTYIDMAMNDIHIDARSEAISLLGIYIYYGELEEISEENLKKIEETILQIALSAEKTKLRQIAIEALGFSSRKEVPALLEKAWQEETALWKASAVFAMGRSYDE
ncbi:MAG: hypothetical protein HN741_12965, partial [Anaerolineae bacterium]|nr:hypothetical protein [Anaerolineae bacterium]